MVVAVTHDIKLQQPFYAPAGEAVLHRYLHPDFIPGFQQDLQRGMGGGAEPWAWQREDRFSPHDNSLVLRQPTHRSFYLISCEVVCDRLGMPALDPLRIVSAGFVIRRVGGSSEQAWMLDEGEPVGWQDAPGGLRDPDLNRRMCCNGVLRRGPTDPAYTGEETHPMHVAAARDPAGKRRTVLYGFIPLGGFHYLRTPAGQSPFDPADEQRVNDFAARQLPWPYGFRDIKPTREGVSAGLTGRPTRAAPGGPSRRVWRSRYERAVEDGRPGDEFFELLRLLVNRYHLGEADRPENEALERFASGLHFTDPVAWAAARRRGARHLDQGVRSGLRGARTLSLLDYLQSCLTAGESNPLVQWFAEQELRIDRDGSLAAATLDPLPRAPGDDRSGSFRDTLLLESADAQELRQLLGARFRSQTQSVAGEIPMPKFGQSPADIYQIVPFVRVKDDTGRERIVWAEPARRSMRFRVAAPLDPEASRPAMIQMPGLGDLKRGLAKGASILVPPDTQRLLDALKLKKGASEDVVPDPVPSGPVLGVQWICSFSLPVITLVAMILLMIMIALLNIVFWWLPWVRICLPFPKIK